MNAELNLQPRGDRILAEFLARQFQEGLALAAASDILNLQPLNGSRSDRYIAEYACRGLVQNDAGEIVEFNRFAVGIWFPEDYLRRLDMSLILTYLGPAPRPFHPNIQAPFACTHITPGTPLVDILYNCYELFTWRLKNTSDEGLNHAASQWARHQDPSWFPIDRRPLRRRKLRLEVQPVASDEHPETSAGSERSAYRSPAAALRQPRARRKILPSHARRSRCGRGPPAHRKLRRRREIWWRAGPMNFPTSALIESVERGLRDKAAKLSRVSNARWVVQFGNGERPPLEVQREDEWLQFTSECNLPTSPNWVGSLWGAVQKNAALPAGIKGAISPARTLELRADLLLSDDTDEESRVRGVVINFEGAWKNDAAMAVARRSENVAELEHLCEEAGWPCVRRSSGRLTVALAVTPVGQATVAFMGDGVRVRVEVADLAAYSSPSRLAVAALALELTSRARLVRASADAESGKLLFEAWWALPPDLAEFDAGLASLSATVRTAGESFAVLQNEQLAKDYLTVRGWTADISHTNQQPERTNR